MKRCGRHGFTLVEVLVVISVISLLLGILLPVISKAREQCYRVICASNLRQFGMTFFSYAGDNNESFPIEHIGRSGPRYYHRNSSTWAVQFSRYLDIEWEDQMDVTKKGQVNVNGPTKGFGRDPSKIWCCPLARKKAILGYVPNFPNAVAQWGRDVSECFPGLHRPHSLLNVKKPSSIMFMTEWGAGQIGPTSNYSSFMNVLAFDLPPRGDRSRENIFRAYYDTDNDGFKDSSSDVYKYNCIGIRHGPGRKSANALMVDGHVKMFSIFDLVENKDDVWGTRLFKW